MFQRMKLRIKTDAKQFEAGKAEEDAETIPIETEEITNTPLDIDSEEAEKTDTVPEAKNNEKNNTKCKKRASDDQKVPGTPQEGDTPMEQEAEKPGEDAVDTTGSQTVLGSQDDNGVRCACGYDEDDGLMILCAVCKFWQHGVCFQIVKEEEAPARHICNTCENVDSEKNKPTDPTLHGLTEVALQATCLWRRALVACIELKRVLPQNMAKQLGVEMTVAQGLVNRLAKEGFLKAPVKSKRFGKMVEKEKLKEGLKKYLKMSTAFPDENDKDENSKSGENLDNEIDKISAKTEALDVSGKQVEQSASVPRKAQKRVKAISGADEFEFDECDSQESKSVDNRKRRKKASIVARSVRV